MPNNLAVVLRTQQLRNIARRTDWDTPGGWRVDQHPRPLADLTGNGQSDIVGFGDAGVWTALSTPAGSFADPRFVLADLGYDQGWRVDQHPRLLADVTGDARADIVAFGNAGTYVALSQGDGSFAFTPVPAIADLGYDQGWRVDQHPRLAADVTGDGRADVVGFGNAGVYVALSHGDGSFAFTPVPVIDDFGYQAGDWRVDQHPRFVADITGDHRADIVGFGNAGVLDSVSNGGDGTFPPRALFVIPNFGYADSGPVEQQGPFLPDPNIGVVQASGGHTRTVFYVGGDNGNRLWKWTDGMATWQLLVPGGGATVARRFFANPYDPQQIYLLDQQHAMRSDDGGVTWHVDASLEQQVTCGGLIPASRDQDADGQGDHYDIVLSDMQFDPFNPQRRFAVGLAGAFWTADGTTWEQLFDTGASRGRPANCYYDWISQPSDPAVCVSFAGRSIVKVSGFAPVVIFGPEEGDAARPTPSGVRSAAAPGGAPVRVQTRDGRSGTTRAMPGDRVAIDLDDGESLVVPIDRLQRQADGTYLV